MILNYFISAKYNNLFMNALTSSAIPQFHIRLNVPVILKVKAPEREKGKDTSVTPASI